MLFQILPEAVPDQFHVLQPDLLDVLHSEIKGLAVQCIELLVTLPAAKTGRPTSCPEGSPSDTPRIRCTERERESPFSTHSPTLRLTHSAPQSGLRLSFNFIVNDIGMACAYMNKILFYTRIEYHT